jgi:hypothetical protein
MNNTRKEKVSCYDVEHYSQKITHIIKLGGKKWWGTSNTWEKWEMVGHEEYTGEMGNGNKLVSDNLNSGTVGRKWRKQARDR